jgi:hypothetical protein
MARQLEDTVFGQLQPHPWIDVLVSEVELEDQQPVQVMLWQYGSKRRKNLRKEHETFAYIKSNLDGIKECVAGAIVQVYRKQPKLFPKEQRRTPKRLIGQIALARVVFQLDGSFHLGFAGAKWFGGHHFVVANFGADRAFIGIDDDPTTD